MAYATKEQLQSWAGYTDGVEETLLDDLLAKAKAIIDNYCETTFDVGSDTDQAFSRHKANPTSRFCGSALYFHEWLADVATTITDTPTVSYLPEDGPPYYGCFLTEGSWAYPTVTINGPWGYSEAGSVPEPIEMACLMLAKWLYEAKDQTGADKAIITPDGRVLMPKGLPYDIKLLLDPYRRVTLA